MLQQQQPPNIGDEKASLHYSCEENPDGRRLHTVLINPIEVKRKSDANTQFIIAGDYLCFRHTGSF